MKRHVSVCCWILLLCLTCSQCTKKADGITGPPGPAGPDGSSTGVTPSAITGYVRLYNEFDVQQPNAANITVSTLENDTVRKTTTDSSGKFSLPKLKAGTYRLLFSGNGVDSFAVNVTHTAGNEDKFIGAVTLVSSSSGKFLYDTYQLYDDPFTPGLKYLDIIYTIADPIIPPPHDRTFIIYFSRTPDVSSKHNFYAFDFHTSGAVANTIEGQFFFENFVNLGITHNPGDSLYFKTYFTPAYPLLTSWFDTNSYTTISYPYIGDSISNVILWPN